MKLKYPLLTSTLLRNRKAVIRQKTLNLLNNFGAVSAAELAAMNAETAEYNESTNSGAADAPAPAPATALVIGSAEANGTTDFTTSYTALAFIVETIDLVESFNAAVDAWIATTGYDVNSGNAYAVRAVFASYTPTGGTIQANYACIARFELVPPDPAGGRPSYRMNIAVIDQTNTDWQSGQLSQDNGSALRGTFTLPVTLTEYTPTRTLGTSWC
jgi:hypothetical protein